MVRSVRCVPRNIFLLIRYWSRYLVTVTTNFQLFPYNSNLIFQPLSLSPFSSAGLLSTLNVFSTCTPTTSPISQKLTSGCITLPAFSTTSRQRSIRFSTTSCPPSIVSPSRKLFSGVSCPERSYPQGISTL